MQAPELDLEREKATRHSVVSFCLVKEAELLYLTMRLDIEVMDHCYRSVASGGRPAVDWEKMAWD